MLQERGVALGRPPRSTISRIGSSTTSPSRDSSGSWFLGSGRQDQRGEEISARTPSSSRSVVESPDLRVEDICGSPFAIVAYETHRDFGGDKALAQLRKRLAERNLKLLLDFVPNHTAPDHPWVQTHPSTTSGQE